MGTSVRRSKTELPGYPRISAAPFFCHFRWTRWRLSTGCGCDWIR